MGSHAGKGYRVTCRNQGLRDQSRVLVLQGHFSLSHSHLSWVSADLQRAPYFPTANRPPLHNREDGCWALVSSSDTYSPESGLLLPQQQIGKPQERD